MDYSWLIEALKVVKIRTKTEGVKPFVPFQWQMDFISKLGIMQNHVVLKSRQIGASTINCAILYLLAVMNSGYSAKIIANKREIAQHLLDTVRIIHEGIPPEIRPKCSYESRWELYFKETNSRLSISASTKDVGRGETINALLASEVAFWENADEAMLGLLECVPRSNSLVIVESTPNGVGNWFHNQYTRAENEEINWLAHKYDWRCLEEYDEEWAEQKRKEKGDVGFAQEYGCSFIMSMRTVFTDYDWIVGQEGEKFELIPSTKMDMIECPVTGKPITISQAKSAGVNVSRATTTFKKTKSERAPVTIWKDPEEKHNYVIGADVAEGLSKGDYSCAYVIDNRTFEVVACWHGHIAPDLFGWELLKLARFYNNALISCEVNNHGLTTINVMKDKYDNLYYREVMDEIVGYPLKKIGWQTTLRTKPLMIDDLAKAVRDRELKVYCDKFKKELSTFVYSDSGKMGAVSGCYDDRVIAMAIAVQAYIANPYISYKPKNTNYMGKKVA